MSKHPLVVDALLALVVVALSWPALDDAASAALTVAIAAPLVVRRRAPFAVFLVIAAAAAAQWLADIVLTADIALLLAIYTVAAYDTRRRLMIAAAVLELGILLATLRWGTESPVLVFVLLSGMATAAIVLGVNLRTRSERAAQAERARIAREMHDIVAHNLSVMVALADGAGFIAESDPKRAQDAMQQVSQTGRNALTEMRRLLGVLHAEAELAPQPGLADLDALLEQVPLQVKLETTGTPVPLGPGAELTVYRLVQEALTNTLKHAGADARATVRLHYEADGIDLEVVDDGSSRAHVSADGRGLSGMRERAAVYGGALEAGPRASGGWRVHARLTT